MAEQARGGAGAAHAVPLVAQAAGVEGERIARLALFLRRAVRVGMELRAPAGGGEAAVGIEPRGALARTWRERPLLGTLVIEQRVAQPREVEIALGGQVLVFLEQRFAAGEVEQAGQAGACLLYTSRCV